MSKPTLIIYGATSFTARELLNYLDTHHDQAEFEVILAGRNQQRLDDAAAKLKRKHKIVACQLNDAEGVSRLVAQGNVVVNLAGPFATHNAEALIRECAKTGKHYVDLTGESHWVSKSIIPEYHFLASQTGACIIPSCGFDSVPSDITVYHALRTLQAQHPSASITNSISFFKASGTVSGGTIQSMKTVAELPAKDRMGGEWQMVGRENQPSTRPRFLYELVNPHLSAPKIGSFFFMWPYNRCIVRRSWALSRQNAETLSNRSLDFGKDKEPVHGDKFAYEESLETGSRVKAFLGSLAVMVFGILFFGSSITRRILLYLLPAAGEGASVEKLKKGWFEVTNVSDTTEPGVQVITTCKAKGDPGYISTCHMLAESALSLVLPPPEGTALPPMAKLGGVLTPATGLGMVLVERLRESGQIQWESKVVTGSKPKSE